MAKIKMGKSMIKKYSILMITSRSDIGGGPKHVYDLARTLKSRFHHKIFIAAPDEQPYWNKYLSVANDCLKIPKRSFNFLALFKVLNFARKNKIDFIHSHGRGAGLFSRLLGIFGYKIIHTFHGAHYPRGIISYIKVCLDRMLVPITKQFICVSFDEKKKALNLKMASNKKTTVVLNGIDLISINHQFKRLRQPKFSDNSTILGTLARFDYQKGLDLLVESISNNHFFFRENNIRMKIAGNGEEFESIKNLIRERKIEDIIILKGEVLNPVQFLAGLDIYTSFSRGEGLPLSVLEAMSCPLPCLLSNVPGHHDLAKNGEALMFNPECSDDFKNQILKLRNNEIKRKVSFNGYKLIGSKHSLSQMTDETNAIYIDAGVCKLF